MTGSFGLSSAASTFTMSGGTINLVQSSTAATPIDYQVSSVATVTGGTLNVGTAATATNFAFRIRGNVPNLVIDNTTNAKSVLLVAQTNTLLNTTINTGTSLNAQSFVWLVFGSTVTNNGTITLATSGARFYFLGTGPQTYTGSAGGTCTIVTAAGSVDLTMDNPAGLTIDPLSGGIITQRVNFFRGGITNANKITLGNGAATVGVVQYGLALGVNTAGNFDVSPTFNIGSGGQTVLYAQEGSARTIGTEIPVTRTILNSTINNTNGVILGGGNLTLTGTLTLTAGNITTNANTYALGAAGVVTRTSGHVIGNFRKNYTAIGNKLFEVGSANGYSPANVNITAATFPVDFTVSATQGFAPTITPTSNAITRYWTLTPAAAGVTANLDFTYLDPTDLNGILDTNPNLHVFRHSAPTYTDLTLSSAATINPATNVAAVNGMTAFTEFTLALAGTTPVELTSFTAD